MRESLAAVFAASDFVAHACARDRALLADADRQRRSATARSPRRTSPRAPRCSPPDPPPARRRRRRSCAAGGGASSPASPGAISPAGRTSPRRSPTSRRSRMRPSSRRWRTRARTLSARYGEPRSAERRGAAAGRHRHGQARRRGAQFLLRRRSGAAVSRARRDRRCARASATRNSSPAWARRWCGCWRRRRRRASCCASTCGCGPSATRARWWRASQFFEDYLPRHGRDWERYAYVKARPITAPERYAEIEAAAVRPFVYRRYLDYGVFESLREMKALIEREIERRELADHVKLGPGGIREIEFIVQALQLTRGGRDRRLQTPSLLRRARAPRRDAAAAGRGGERAGGGLRLPAPAREPPADARRQPGAPPARAAAGRASASRSPWACATGRRSRPRSMRSASASAITSAW